MKKFGYFCAAMVLLSTCAQAAPAVTYKFFDSPVKQGERFQEAFPIGTVISEFTIDNKKYILPNGHWVVANSWFDISELQKQGGGFNDVRTTGTLILAKNEGSQVSEVIRFRVSLQNLKARSWMRDIHSSCLQNKNTIDQKIIQASDTSQRCILAFSAKTDFEKSDHRLLGSVNNLAKLADMRGIENKQRYTQIAMVGLKNTNYFTLERTYFKLIDFKKEFSDTELLWNNFYKATFSE